MRETESKFESRESTKGQKLQALRDRSNKQKWRPKISKTYVKALKNNHREYNFIPVINF